MLDQTYSSSFEVQQVVDEKLIDGETHFLVKWVGYDHSENTWEPFRHMTHSKDKIKEWQQFKINQLNLASNRKLHEQLNVSAQKNRPKTNSQTFKNVSNPYKKVYLRIDEEEQFKPKESEQGRTKIQTIFDQPEMKRIIKIKKSDRKKKELQLFEKRLKTRPKIWEKYLQNEDQVIKRANQKIKQVIDKAYGGNQKNKDFTNQKDVLLTNNQSQVKKKTQNIPFESSNGKIRTNNSKIQQLVLKQASSSNEILEKGLVSKQKNQSNKPSTKQFKPMKRQVKQKPNLKVKNIFFSTQQQDSLQIVDNLSKRKQSQTQKNHKTQKNNKIKSKLLIHSDSSIEQETNFISLKDNNINHNKAVENKHFLVQNTKFQKSLPQIIQTVNKGSVNVQRKTWVRDLVKEMVQENKKKDSIVIKNQLKQQRKVFTIQPQTIMVTQVMRKKLKGEKVKQNQIQLKRSEKIQMQKISEQSQINSYFSRKSSVSNYVHQGMFRLNKLSYKQPKSLQVQTQNGNPEVLIVEQKQKDVVEQCPQEKIQVQQQVPIEIQNSLGNKQNQNKQLVMNGLIPFQCSISSVDQSLNKNSENNSFVEQFQSNLIVKPQETAQNCPELGHKYSPQYSCSQSQQQNDQSQPQMIQNQQQPQRVINYSSLTNHMSTTLPQHSDQSQNINIHNPNGFLNLIRQQSMTTRDSQRIQQPINNNGFNSRSLPNQSINYQLNPIQNQSQHQQFQIPQNSQNLIKINYSQQLSFQLEKQNKQQQKANNNILQQKSYQNLHIPNPKTVHQQEKSFQSNKIQNYEQKCESITEEKQSPLQHEIINYFLFEQQNQQIQLQVFTINKESNSKKEELKLPSFVKENPNKCMNDSNNNLSNKDKQSLILKYDFSSIN